MGGIGIAEILPKCPWIVIDIGGFLNGIHGTDLNPQTAATFIAGILVYNAFKVLKMNRTCRAVRMTASATHTDSLLDEHALTPW
jgi:hypothetical protein